MNYKVLMKRGPEARRGRFYFWDWQRKQVIPLVLHVDSGSQHIECECIFHDSALGVKERKGGESKRTFLGVYTETQQCHKINVCLALCFLNAFLFHCLTHVQHIAGVTVVNNMCHGQVLHKKAW